jgi:hypothetical protein
VIERSLLSPVDDNGRSPRLVLAHVPSDGCPAAVVVPIEELARPAIRKTNFEAACILDALRAMGDDANCLGHIHDLSPFDWRVMQSASHHFAPQVFSSLFNQRVIGWPISVWSISLDLLFDVFVKQGDAMVG